MLRLLLVEDEEMVARHVQRVLEDILGDSLEVLFTADDLWEAQNVLDAHAVDIVLLDLNLFGDDGFRLLEHAAARAVATVVISAHPERALEGFDHGVVDFVAKPVRRERLEVALDRATAGLTSGLRPAILVRAYREQRVVELDSVVKIRAARDYARIFTDDGARHLYQRPLADLERLLPARFLRVHRSWIVDLNRTDRLVCRPGSRYSLFLDDGSRIPVGRSRLQEIRARLGEGATGA